MPEFVDDGPIRGRDLFTSAVLAAGVAALLARALPALVQTFWIDEAGTWWLIDGGWPELVARWRSWPYQSLAHSAVALAARQLLGANEWALRLPSVLAAAAAVVLFHRLARRLIGRLGAAAAVLTVLGSPSFYFALTMARPYGLGLLALVISWSALLDWDRLHSSRQLAIWAAATVAVGFLHFTLALGVVAQLPWLWNRWRQAERRERRQLATAAAGVALGGLTLAGSLIATVATLPLLDMFDERGSSIHPLAVLTPTALGFPLLLLVAVAAALGAWPPIAARRSPGEVLRIAGPLWLIPLLVTYVAHSLRLAALNQDRYQMAGQLGLALVVGLTVEQLPKRGAQRASLALLALLVPFTAVTDFWPLYDGRDWRAAARASSRIIAADELVLVQSVFIESNHAASFAELERVGRWSALQVAYPLAGTIMPLPRDVLPATERFAEERLERLGLGRRSRLSLLQIRAGPWLSWLLAKHPEFEIVGRHRLGRLDWLLFERRSSVAE